MIIAITVALLIAFAIMWFVARQQGRRDSDRTQQNINIVRQEFLDLKAELEAGQMTQAEYQKAYDELVATLGSDLEQNAADTTPRYQFSQTKTLLGIFAILAVLTPVLYYQLGTPTAVHPNSPQAIEAAQQAAGANTPPSITAMVEGLRQKLDKDPSNTEGWTMLGRSYMVLHNYTQAVSALSKAYSQRADDPSIMLMYADALAMQNGGRINDKAFKLIKRVLAHAPNDPTAMWMAAMAYETQSDYKSAIVYWQRLLPRVKDNPKDYQEVSMHLAQAEAKLGGKPMASASAQTQQPAAAGGASVTAVIKLDAKYKSRVKPGETVFVYARAVNGPPQPLAAKKLQVSDLPATVTLNDAMAMSPMNKLSDYAQVYIGARVSQTGNVMPSRGDLQGRSGSVSTTSGKQIEVTIDKEIM